jgi:hypothetical protein
VSSSKPVGVGKHTFRRVANAGNPIPRDRGHAYRGEGMEDDRKGCAVCVCGGGGTHVIVVAGVTGMR